jgi:hypothetical protein
VIKERFLIEPHTAIQSAEPEVSTRCVRPSEHDIVVASNLDLHIPVCRFRVCAAAAGHGELGTLGRPIGSGIRAERHVAGKQGLGIIVGIKQRPDQVGFHPTFDGTDPTRLEGNANRAVDIPSKVEDLIPGVEDQTAFHAALLDRLLEEPAPPEVEMPGLVGHAIRGHAWKSTGFNHQVGSCIGCHTHSLGTIEKLGTELRPPNECRVRDPALQHVRGDHSHERPFSSIERFTHGLGIVEGMRG